MRAAAVGLVALAACTSNDAFHEPEMSFERMIHQPKVDAYERSDLFTDHRAMRAPPDGSVSRGSVELDAALEYGAKNNAYLVDIPISVDLTLLRRGRNRFEIYCATCHGVLGNGVSPVADSMRLVRPPSLVTGRVRAFSSGQVFRVVREGFGLMPSYRAELDAHDRWAVVAYLQALQLREQIPLDRLTPALEREAKGELK